MYLLKKLLYFIFTFISFFNKILSQIIIDEDIKKYFNQEYIEEISKFTGKRTKNFCLFEIDPDYIGYDKIRNYYTFRSKRKFNVTTKNGKNIDNTYIFISEYSSKLICCKNDNPTIKYELINYEIKMKFDGLEENDLDYLDCNFDLEPVIFKIKVEEKNHDSTFTTKEIYCFCEAIDILTCVYRIGENKWIDFKKSLYDSKYITEFTFCRVFYTNQDVEYKNEHMYDNFKLEESPQEIKNNIEGDPKKIYYLDCSDISDICTNNVFKNCSNLKKISFRDNKIEPYWNDYILHENNFLLDCKNLEELEIDNVEFKNIFHFRGFKNLKYLTLKKSNSIHSFSFAYCDNLQEIKFVDDDGKEIVVDQLRLGNAGIKNCKNLKSIGAKTLIIDSERGNSSVFENCKNLKIENVRIILDKDCPLINNNSFKNMFKGIDPILNKNLTIEFVYKNDTSKIRYSLDFDTIFNGCDSKKNIEITTPDGQKQILEDVQNNDKIDEFLLNPVRYIKYRTFYQKITKEQLIQYNYFENIDIDNENIRNSILNNTYNDIINNINQDIKKDLNNDIPKPNTCCLCCGKFFTNCCCCKRNV